jgi:hypothetical protein
MRLVRRYVRGDRLMRAMEPANGTGMMADEVLMLVGYLFGAGHEDARIVPQPRKLTRQVADVIVNAARHAVIVR